MLRVIFLAENLHVKLNNALEIRVQYFLDEIFPAVIIFRRKGLFLTDSVKN